MMEVDKVRLVIYIYTFISIYIYIYIYIYIVGEMSATVGAISATVGGNKICSKKFKTRDFYSPL